MTIDLRFMARAMRGRCAGLCNTLVFAALFGVATASAATQNGDLPPCVAVDAALTKTIDTKIVKPGDLFSFSTVNPVVYAGATVPSGTSGSGIIVTSDHSKSQGHSGYLVLEARFLQLADGTHVPVLLRPGGDGRSPAFVRAGSSSAGLIGYLPYYIGTAAGIYNVFHHGKDAAVVAGALLPLVVGDDVYRGACAVGADRH